MSMDNGHIIRKNDAGRYVLQMYFASAESYPAVEQGDDVGYDTLEAAVLEYERRGRESDYILDEYGLSINVS